MLCGSTMAAVAAETLKRLDAARQLVLSDANHYTTILTGILPIIGAHSYPTVRRWGADFFAETFANPMLPVEFKEALGLLCLETLKQLLEVPGEAEGVVKSVIQAAASIYGSVFRYMYVESPNPLVECI